MCSFKMAVPANPGLSTSASVAPVATNSLNFWASSPVKLPESSAQAARIEIVLAVDAEEVGARFIKHAGRDDEAAESLARASWRSLAQVARKGFSFSFVHVRFSPPLFRLLTVLFLSLGPHGRRHDGAKTKMIGAGLDFAFAARANDVARAILVIAKKRAAAMDALFLARLGRIEGCSRGLCGLRATPPLSASCCSNRGDTSRCTIARRCRPCRKGRSRWRKLRHRRDAGVTVSPVSFTGKLSLLGVGHPFSAGPKLIAPDIGFTGQSAARGKFELRFGREGVCRPTSRRPPHPIGDMHDRIIFFSLDVALRSERMPPVRALNVAPPLKVVVERHVMIGRSEDDRAGHQVLAGAPGNSSLVGVRSAIVT